MTSRAAVLARRGPHPKIFNVSRRFNCNVDECIALTMAGRVCIIGAGVSGLRCATVLLEHGVEVVMIEARDRIGGRVRIPFTEIECFRLFYCRLRSPMEWV